MADIRARLDDVDERLDGAPQLVLGVVEMRAEQVDQELRQVERALANARDADVLDDVVACRRRVQCGNVRRAGEEAADARRVLELRLECERARVTLPADEGRLETFREIGAHVQPASAGAAAQPLDAPADGEVDSEAGQIDRYYA